MKYITKTYGKTGKNEKGEQRLLISYKDNIQKAYEKAQLRF